VCVAVCVAVSLSVCEVNSGGDCVCTYTSDRKRVFEKTGAEQLHQRERESVR